MVNDGMTQAQVARELGINVATIRRWLARERSEEALENCTGRGQKSSLSRVAKIAISKWTFKGHHSTSALATKLTEMQHPTSKLTVHQYLKTSLKLKSLKLRMQRWFDVNQKRRRLDFVKAHKTGPFRTRGVSL